MPKFDIPVIIQVETDNINAARQTVYKALEALGQELGLADVSMADDSIRVYGNRRAIILHPEDAHADYDEETYKSNLDEDEG